MLFVGLEVARSLEELTNIYKDNRYSVLNAIVE